MIGLDNMKTIIVNHKMYEIQNDIYCSGCMFYDRKNNPHCKQKHGIQCVDGEFIYIRQIKFFERIKLWLKKKMNK